jgi:hypothetical protein
LGRVFPPPRFEEIRMRYGNYSVLVPEGVERESGYVGLPHGTQYTLRLGNHDYRRCDAEVTVDGKRVGVFRLNGHGSTTLERSPDDHGKFTFYSSGTGDAGAAGEAGVAAADKGLIQVRFVPERRRKPVHTPPVVMRTATVAGGGQSQLYGSARPMNSTTPTSFNEEKTSGGITGLSGHSDQRFVDVWRTTVVVVPG